MPTSRAWTQEEIQDKFLEHMWDIVDYWDKEDRATTSREKLEGLLRSFLVALDGNSMALPAFELIPLPHPIDKEYHIKKGENYYEECILPENTLTVHGNKLLHDRMYDIGRKLGYVPLKK